MLAMYNGGVTGLFLPLFPIFSYLCFRGIVGPLPWRGHVGETNENSNSFPIVVDRVEQQNYKTI